MANNPRFTRITIVGLGVIGGSYAKALSALGYTVFGVDRDEQTCELAVRTGAVAKACDTPAEFFGNSDLIVFALYPSQIADYLHENLDAIAQNCVLTDVAGLKSHFVSRIRNSLAGRPDLQFVFCHPMAGREKRGFAYADPAVFRGANFIITPTQDATQETIARIEALAIEMGFGRVKRISPEEHDKRIAFTSQLPHAMAVALVNSDTRNDTGAFIGDSYRDLTRIANINEDLWTQLFLENKDNLVVELDAFASRLQDIRDAVASSDAQALREYFVSATEKRKKL